MVKKKGKGKKGKKGKKKDPAEREKTSKRMELSLELEMGEMNARKFREAWRERMKNMNLPVIKENLEAAWKAFDRTVDNKNYTISVLLDGLDGAEEQKRRCENLHMDAIDKLIGNYMKIVDDAESKYRSAVKTAVDDEGQITDTMKSDQDDKEMFLKVTTFATKEAYERSIEMLQSRNTTKLDTRKEDLENDLGIAQLKLRRRVRSLLEQNAKILQDYEERTRDKRKQYEIAKKRHDEDQRIIAEDSRRIEKLYVIIQDLKVVILEFRKKYEKEISDYRFERDYFYGARLFIQKRLVGEQNFDKEQLKVSTVEYNVTAKFLDERLERVEKILSMVALCEKYETFEDKVIIYPISASNNETTCQEVHKLIKVVISVERDLDQLRNLLNKSVDKSNFLKDSLKSYMEKLMFGEHKPCKPKKDGKPEILKLRDVIHY